MNKPSINTDESNHKISIKIIFLLISIAILFQILLFAFPAIAALIIEMSILSISILIVIFSFITAKLYFDSEIFFKSHLALGLAFLMLVLGEIIGYTSLFLYGKPNLGLIELFYILSYPLIIYYLQKNIFYFYNFHTQKLKIIVIIVPIVITSVFVILTIDNLNQFDYPSRVLWTIISSVSLGFGLLGIIVFRKTVLSTVWQIIVFGLFLNTFGDIWSSYHDVVFSIHDHTNLYHVLWLSGLMLICYGLYKHQKTL